jgi:hypothetical protein
MDTFFPVFPFSFFVNIPGLPDPNFMQTAILPILSYCCAIAGTK